MILRINPQPNYKKAIHDISNLKNLESKDFKKAVLNIVGQIAFDEILDITIEECENESSNHN